LLELYTIDDLVQLRKKFLEFIRALVPFNEASFTLASEINGRVELNDFVSVDMPDEFIKKYNTQYYKVDYINYIYNFEKSMVYKDSDIVENNMREKTEFYQNYLLPEKVPFAGGIVLVKSRILLGVITLFRSSDYGDLEEKDLEILEIFKNHLENIFFKLQCQRQDKRTLIFEKFTFSKREIEVIDLVVHGLSNQEISNELSISTSTVKKHINNIFYKLGVASRSQLIAKFL
jgi:DNA-binding CsgD family transcriptional regulator